MSTSQVILSLFLTIANRRFVCPSLGRVPVGVARRARLGAAKQPYIRRNIPSFEILSEEALTIIEHNAKSVLNEIGITFRRDPITLELWRNAVAEMHREWVRTPLGLC